jgi:hypothetical protein
LPVEPTRANATTLVIAGATPSAVANVVTSVLAQRERPAEVVFAVAPGMHASNIAGLAPLHQAGIGTRVVEGGAAYAVHAATAPWTNVVTAPDLPADHLLDLHVVRACRDSASVVMSGSEHGARRPPRVLVRTEAVRAGTVNLIERDGALEWDAR